MHRAIIRTSKFNVKALSLQSPHSSSSQQAKDTIHLIKRKSHALTYTEQLQNERFRHYVIGFPNAVLARRIQYMMAPEPCIRLYRRDAIDVTDEVNAGLSTFGVNQVSGTVTIDPRATLHIPKQDQALPADHPMNDGMYHLAIIPIEEFLMFPFEKNLGIIMPYEVQTENTHEIVLLSNVVESAESMDSFRRSLKI